MSIKVTTAWGPGLLSQDWLTAITLLLIVLHIKYAEDQWTCNQQCSNELLHHHVFDYQAIISAIRRVPLLAS